MVETVKDTWREQQGFFWLLVVLWLVVGGVNYVSIGQIDGTYMAPAFQGDQYVWVRRMNPVPSNYSHGDVVRVQRYRFSGKEQTVYGRIVGVPGDRLRFREGLIRNGSSVNSFRIQGRFENIDTTEEFIVPKRTVYLLTDHQEGGSRQTPLDSRKIGPVPVELIDGTVHAFPFFS